MKVPASEVLSKVECTWLYHELGGPEPQYKRYLPFWRQGEHYNVSINNEKGCWFDFSRREGGGKLDLIQKVLDCDKRTALRWVADKLHIDVDQPLTPAERYALRERRRRKQHLERLRQALLLVIKSKAKYYCDYSRRVRRWADEHIGNPAKDNDLRWELVQIHFNDDYKGDVLWEEFERIKKMDLEAFAAFYLVSSERKAA